MEAIKTRRLKKADFEVDFFFIGGSGVDPSPVNPKGHLYRLGEMRETCQYFLEFCFECELG